MKTQCVFILFANAGFPIFRKIKKNGVFPSKNDVFGADLFPFWSLCKMPSKLKEPARISFFFLWNLPQNQISNCSVMAQKRPIRKRSPRGWGGVLNINRPYKESCGPNWDLSRPMHGQSGPISNAFRTTMVQVDLPNRILSGRGGPRHTKGY